ncbi:MAG: BtpA/SgcQ family protein [Thermodesulfobacteriota bacterium]
MKDLFTRDFGRRRFLMGMIHTLPLPGAPRYDRAGGPRKIVAQAREEAKILAEAGFHALLYCNESDMPYLTEMEPATIAAMTEVVAETQALIGLPHGINMLLDPAASLAIANATGGRFIRAFLTGATVGDTGLFVADGPGVLRLRANLGAEDIRIICNVTPGFSVSLDSRPVEEQAAGAVFIGLADAVCVSGPAAGREADLDLLRRVAARVPETPVVVGTGVSAANIEALAEVADGFIVGTSLKINGQTLNPLDPVRVKEFMAVARKLDV